MMERVRAFAKALPLAFWPGALIGLGAAALGYGPMAVTKYPLEISVAGADMSRRGASTVTITDHDIALAQACADDCDDLIVKFRYPSEPAGPKVSIRATDGRVIVDGQSYVSGVFADHDIYDEQSLKRDEELRRELGPR